MKLARLLFILPALAALSLSSCNCCNTPSSSVTSNGINRARTFYTYDQYAPRHRCDVSHIWPAPPNNYSDYYWCDTYGKLNWKF